MHKEVKGNIFDIQHFSVGDGPGIRTTVFLKGCPLRCEWCHNPESQKSGPQVMYHKHRCVHCAACAAVCPSVCHRIDAAAHFFDSEKCIGCGRCAEACHFGGLETAGRSVSVESVINEVAEDAVFYEDSQGGMTLSGGEPLYQPEFAIALAKAAKEKNIHVCVETSGFGPSGSILALAEYTDIFLYDYKATGDDHQRFTGVDNELILRNLFLLDAKGCQIILRCPMVPGRNLTDAHIHAIIVLAKRLKNLIEIDIEPYHNIGAGKREGLGMRSNYEKITPPSKQTMQQLAQAIEADTHIKTVVM